MLNHAHLLLQRMGNALRDIRRAHGLIAGITVGLAAIPLSMAIAIASGLAPQQGLYMAIVSGFVMALIGDSNLSLSGPAAVVVVILYPVAQAFGIAGVLVVSLLAGAILVGMALLRLGWLVDYLPPPAARGIATGIGILMATLQMKDFFGIHGADFPASFIGQLGALVTASSQVHWSSVVVGCSTLAVMLLWPRLKTPVPALLPALLVGMLIAMTLNAHGLVVETVGSRFSYALADGTTAQGIPPALPAFAWPWLQSGVKGLPMPWSLAVFQALLPSAFGIAMLAAMQSLMFDDVPVGRHRVNRDLLGRGIGNLVAPFFGGITMTFDRSATNTNADALSPLPGIVHALVVMLVIIFGAPLLSYFPLASMAAFLMAAAWKISAVQKTAHLLKTAHWGMIAALLAWLSLTLLFDVVFVIAGGILCAAVSFVRDIARSTAVIDISINRNLMPHILPSRWRVIRVNGSLFYAVSERVFIELGALAENKDGLIIHLGGVPTLDNAGLAELQRFVEKCEKTGTRLIFTEMQFQLLKLLREANVNPAAHMPEMTMTLQEALSCITTKNSALSNTAFMSNT